MVNQVSIPTNAGNTIFQIIPKMYGYGDLTAAQPKVNTTVVVIGIEYGLKWLGNLLVNFCRPLRNCFLNRYIATAIATKSTTSTIANKNTRTGSTAQS